MELGFLLCVACRLLAVIRLTGIPFKQFGLRDVQDLAVDLDLKYRLAWFIIGIGLLAILGRLFRLAIFLLSLVRPILNDLLVLLLAVWLTLFGFLWLSTQSSEGFIKGKAIRVVGGGREFLILRLTHGLLQLWV